MRAHSIIALTFLLAACGTPPGDDSTPDLPVAHAPILPDTQTVSGVLEMRHGADAFARAQAWTLSAKPDVVIEGGENPDFDLTRVTRLARFANGRVLATHGLGPARLMLFRADGSPLRVVARSGEGPGDVMAPIDPVAWGGDTVLVHDFVNHRVSWITSDGKVARAAPDYTVVDTWLWCPVGR